MSATLQFLKDNWGTIATALVALCTLANRLAPPNWQGLLSTLIDLLSASPRPGKAARVLGAKKPLSHGWKFPLAMRTHHESHPALAPVPCSGASLRVLPLLLAALGAVGCAYCQTHAAEPVCQAEVIVVRCAAPEIAKAAAAVLPAILNALQGEDVDWAALLHLEEQYGLEAVACAVRSADQAPQAHEKLATPPGCRHLHGNAARAMARFPKLRFK